MRRSSTTSTRRGVRAGSLALVFTLALSGVTAAQDELAFVRGLEWVRTLMAQGRWLSAESRLHQLLDRHKDTNYARARRTAVVENMKRCRFQLSGKAPSAQQLITGKLVRHGQRTGQLTLRYEPSTLGDFEPPQANSGVRLHPAEFTGPYKVVMQVERYPGTSGGVQMVINESPQHAIVVSFGVRKAREHGSVPMSIYRLGDNGERTPLSAPRQSLARSGQRYRVTVKVESTTILAMLDGRVVMRATKPRAEFGRVGIVTSEFDGLTLEGPAARSWLQGLVDARTLQQLARFERFYDPRADLPPWLFADDHPEARNQAADHGYPGDIEPEHVEALNQANALIRDKQFVAARDFVEGLAHSEISRGARAYLLAICAFSRNEHERALDHCDAAGAEDPNFAGTRMLRARLHVQLRHRDQAIAELRSLLTDHPRFGPAYAALALQLLHSGDPAKAHEVVLTARRRGADVPQIEQLDRMLTMAESGPAWSRSWTYRSSNYIVSSDVSRSVCVETARLLERCFSAYQAQLAPARKVNGRFRVFVFSGEAGYRSYCAHVLGSPTPHSMGLFSPALKQLLIRNVPEHETMLETVRHEGLHQYLDGVMTDPPAWLNEGLAMYYEANPKGEARPRGGSMRPDLLASLRRQRMAPLSTLTSLDLGQFYADSELHYPQSWAFVHFLRDTTRQRRLMFRRIFDALRAGKSNAEALRAGLRQKTLAELDREFREHVIQLELGTPARTPR